jgi:hypothetical protein
VGSRCRVWVESWWSIVPDARSYLIIGHPVPHIFLRVVAAAAALPDDLLFFDAPADGWGELKIRERIA